MTGNSCGTVILSEAKNPCIPALGKLREEPALSSAKGSALRESKSSENRGVHGHQLSSRPFCIRRLGEPRGAKKYPVGRRLGRPGAAALRPHRGRAEDLVLPLPEPGSRAGPPLAGGIARGSRRGALGAAPGLAGLARSLDPRKNGFRPCL